MFGLDEKEWTEDAKKWVISAVSAVVFLVIAAPFTYEWTQRLIAKPLGLNFLTASGAVTNIGLMAHTLVFFLIVRALMW